eukprot:gene12625-16929_t
MNYSFRCILPHDRFLTISSNGTLNNLTQEDTTTNNNTDLHYIESNLVDYTINIPPSILKLEQNGLFEFTPKLLFLHEKDLRDLLLFNDIQDVELENNSKNQNMHETYNHLITSYSHPCIYIYHIGIIDNVNIGYGVFTNESIVEGIYLAEYTGIVTRSSSTSSPEQKNYSVHYPSCNHDNDLEINASEYGNITRFINHSYNPNAEFRRICHNGIFHIAVFTLSRIEKNCQVTINYGQSYWLDKNIIPKEMPLIIPDMTMTDNL